MGYSIVVSENTLKEILSDLVASLDAPKVSVNRMIIRRAITNLQEVIKTATYTRDQEPIEGL